MSVTWHGTHDFTHPLHRILFIDFSSEVLAHSQVKQNVINILESDAGKNA